MPPHCDTMDGPVVMAAKEALEEENVNIILPWAPKEVTEFLSHVVEEELQKRLEHAMSLKTYDAGDVDSAREYVEAMLEFILYSHKLYVYMTGSGGHAREGEHKH